MPRVGCTNVLNKTPSEVSKEVFRALSRDTGWGSAQKAGDAVVCAGVNVGVVVRVVSVAVGETAEGIVRVAEGIGDGGTAVGGGGGAVVTGAHAVSRINPIQRICFIFMAFSTR
jgi:hypothetical protein